MGALEPLRRLRTENMSEVSGVANDEKASGYKGASEPETEPWGNGRGLALVHLWTHPHDSTGHTLFQYVLKCISLVSSPNMVPLLLWHLHRCSRKSQKNVCMCADGILSNTID